MSYPAVGDSYDHLRFSEDLFSQIAGAPWVRSLGKTSTNISSQHLRSRRLPASCRSLIRTTAFRKANFFHNERTSLYSNDSSIEKTTRQTLTEKIVQRHAVGLPEGKLVRTGDYVQIKPHRCMSHDNTWPIAKKFMSIGATRIEDPNQLV